MESNKNSVLLTVLGVCTLLVALIGASFAFFSAQSTTQTENVKTGELKVVTTLNRIESDNIKPTTFDQAEAAENDDVAKLTFNVKGTGTTVDGGKYSIYILGAATPKEVGGAGGSLDDIKYELYQGSVQKAQGKYSDIVSDTPILEDIDLTSATDDNYTLYVYINESGSNQDKLQNIDITTTMYAKAQTPDPAGV